MICSPGQLEREWTLLAGGLDSGLDDGANFFGIDENDLLCLDSSLADDAEVQFVLDSSGEPMSHARVQKLRAPAQSPPAPPFRSSPRPRPLPINRPAAALPRPEPVPGPPVRRDDAAAAAVRQRRAAPGHHGQHAAQAPALEPVSGGVGRGSHLTPSPLGGRPGSALGGHHRHRADGRPSSALGGPPGLSIRKINFSTSPSPQPGAENGGGLAPRPTSAPAFRRCISPFGLFKPVATDASNSYLTAINALVNRPQVPLPAHPPRSSPHPPRISRTTNLTPHLFPSPRRSGRRARRRATRSRRSRAPGAPSKPTRSTRRSRSRSSRRRRPVAPRRRAPPSPPLAVASARTRSCRRRRPVGARRRARGGRRRRSRRRARARAAPAPRRARVSLPSRRSGEHDASTTQEFGAYREVRAARTRSEADPPATMCNPALPVSPRPPPVVRRWVWLYAPTQLCQPTLPSEDCPS